MGVTSEHMCTEIVWKQELRSMPISSSKSSNSEPAMDSSDVSKTALLLVEKKVRNLEYKDLLLRKCKQHGGPFVNLSEVRDFVNQQKDDSKQLRTHLRQEIGFQKLLHPVDAKERPHLYKMNELTCEQLTENITILLDSTIDATEEEVLFPNEDDIMEILNEKCNDALVENTTAGFQPQQPLAVVRLLCDWVVCV